MKNYWKRKGTDSIEISVHNGMQVIVELDTSNCWKSKNDIESKLKTNRIWNPIKMAGRGTLMNAWVAMENG